MDLDFRYSDNCIKAKYPKWKPFASVFVSSLCTTQKMLIEHNPAMQNRIKELRKKAGLSQEALANSAGTTKATVMKLETGAMKLTTTWMERLSKGLGCSPKSIISFNEKETALPEPVVAIVDVLKILLSTFTSKGIASKNELLSRLTHQKAEYLEPEQKGALEVVEELLNYLTQIQPEAKGGLNVQPPSPSLVE